MTVNLFVILKMVHLAFDEYLHVIRSLSVNLIYQSSLSNRTHQLKYIKNVCHFKAQNNFCNCKLQCVLEHLRKNHFVQPSAIYRDIVKYKNHNLKSPIYHGIIYNYKLFSLTINPTMRTYHFLITTLRY